LAWINKKAHLDQPKHLISPVAGVILAAGAASRMGQPKLLLPWLGEALICHAARTALAAGLDPVVVITGASEAGIRSALDGLAVQMVHNPDWEAGQSTSVRVGIEALPSKTQAVIFLLADQPFVTPELVQALVQTYLQNRPAILAPFVGEKRTNPVLFDRSIFEYLRGLQGDAGARTIFTRIPPTRMPWPDARLLFDVDTPQDYERLVASSGISDPL
jgi:molybdenum cofactor cytidylyltransferase